MKLSVAFIRSFFILLSVLFTTAWALSANIEGEVGFKLLMGIGAGLVFGLLVSGLGRYFERFSLRIFNIATLGLFFGYLMGQAVVLILQAVIGLSVLELDPALWGLARTMVFLVSIYLSMTFTVRSAEEITLSIPFIQFNPNTQKKKDILVDSSIVLDTRIIDVVASGLLDNYLIIPRYLLNELLAQSESDDESIKTRARRSLEIIKKMESMSALGLRFTDVDLPDVKDPVLKLIRVARLIDANILTADISRIQQSEIEGVRVINIHSLSNSLKPVAQAGEFITIKIQRYGKEPRQGVGYLEDGTMVVVNGGAEFIGESIRARVLSVKHTSSGRMIFCNATDEWMNDSNLATVSQQTEQEAETPENTAKKYFTV